MLSEKEAADSTLQMRAPTIDDAREIWRLVGETGVLDKNSSYLYLLLCRDFSDTCLVAETDGQVVGFVTAYRVPARSDTLFVWQIGVGKSARRQGVALKLLTQLATRTPSLRFVEATVAGSNLASRRLFEAFARNQSVPLMDLPQEGFQESDFPPGGHEAEPLLRIGPLD